MTTRSNFSVMVFAMIYNSDGYAIFVLLLPLILTTVGRHGCECYLTSDGESKVVA